MLSYPLIDWRSLVNLENISLPSLALIDYPNASPFTGTMPKFPTLKKLEINFTGPDFSSCWLKNLLVWLRDQKNVEDFRVHGYHRLPIEAVETIAKFTGARLRKLSLTGCEMLKDSCFFNLKARFPKLIYLDVSQCQQLQLSFLAQNFQDADTVPTALNTVVVSGVAHETEDAKLMIELARKATRNQLQIVI